MNKAIKHPIQTNAFLPCDDTLRHPSPLLQVRNLSVSIKGTRIFENITFDLAPRHVFGILGPSGAGKSTLLRCLNRLIELTPGHRISGEILFHGQNILSPSVDADELRSRIGMIFQQPVVFPTTIARNVLFGVKHLRRLTPTEGSQLVERSLREAALWEQVKDRLNAPGQILSIGQQQRLCLARTLASDPEVILMDEPTSALDPDTTRAIEDLILSLGQSRSIILVTHNPAQTRRICDGCFLFAKEKPKEQF